jgi:hypothetical protein
MEDQYCKRQLPQGRILKRSKGTSEEGFKLGLFWELEKNGNILVQPSPHGPQQFEHTPFRNTL